MDDLSKPKAGVLDVVHTGVKATLSLIPYGGLAAEGFSAVIAPPIEKRRDRWMEAIVKKLGELEEKIESFSIQELSQNELFVSVLFQASKVAISTHQKEKINNLRNAVLNAAYSNNIDDDMQLTFIRFIDDFTERHIRTLKFMNDPVVWLQQNSISKKITDMGKITQAMFGRSGDVTYSDHKPEGGNSFKDCRVININDYQKEFESIFPEIKNNGLFYNQILRDLNAKDLIYPQSINAINLDISDNSGTTKLGRQFIDFITSPINN